MTSTCTVVLSCLGLRLLRTAANNAELILSAGPDLTPWIVFKISSADKVKIPSLAEIIISPACKLNVLAGASMRASSPPVTAERSMWRCGW